MTGWLTRHPATLTEEEKLHRKSILDRIPELAFATELTSAFAEISPNPPCGRVGRRRGACNQAFSDVPHRTGRATSIASVSPIPLLMNLLISEFCSSDSLAALVEEFRAAIRSTTPVRSSPFLACQ
ncbi:hypothetical protein [Streptomyces sp. NPDC001933]|uniref:hypothetical protein n=1 Tax=Streptomyces sp. NPDC001933 TaxID=3364626 RepID=UPI0036C0277B